MPTLIDAPISTFVPDEAAMLRIEAIVEQDDPVDNPLSEKQRILLSEPLDSSWTPPPADDRPGERRKFWAAVDVGVFASDTDFLAPDNFVVLDVESPSNWKAERAYHLWKYKPPLVAVEIVSNRVGHELGSKRDTYARWGIEYYIVYDPGRELRGDVLYVFVLDGDRYVRTFDHFLPKLGLGVTIWEGVYANRRDTYLRWCDASGSLIPTGKEAAAKSHEERDQAVARAERYLALLRAQGIDPEAG